MIELTAVLIIILLFVFPLPALAVSLGLLTLGAYTENMNPSITSPPKGRKT